MRLSVCLIAKNEENNIGKCLKSVQGLADEIIVVDTGSEDSTVEIAKSLGAKIFYHKWNNSFADARNVSLDNATGDWILCLDADEEIPKDDSEKLRKYFESEKFYQGFFFRSVNILNGAETDSFIVLRAFRNRPEHRFVGRIHEQVPIVGGFDNVRTTDVRIFHYGYDPNIVDENKKSQRNLDILLSLPEEEKTGYYYYNLGNEYAKMHDFKTALTIYNKSIQKSNFNTSREIYFAYLIINILKSYLALNKFTDMVNTVEKYKVYFPNFKDMYFMAALAERECGKYSRSKFYLNKYTTCKDGNYDYPDNGFDKSNNLSALFDELNNMIVWHPSGLLTTCIIVTSPEGKLIDCVKSCNELSDEILIIDANSNHEDIKNVSNYGAKVIGTTKNNILKTMIKKSSMKWILWLNPNEVFPYGQQSYLVDELNNTKATGIKLAVLDLKTYITQSELRILKKQNIKANSIEELEKTLLTSSKKIDSLDSNIFKY
ncbi:glycosyltransferase [Clostridium tarantellae]|uniref:Glycosyltransferase n=1 Tax=Clostridium tarantellae TaxID=39493 RepID=A0A6I1MQN0_9CLOT|nr:glycosyltransferase [Clostridium tarantellae]MPQ44467.1 glycosyltransferase [Clostridium tarantellae]